VSAAGTAADAQRRRWPLAVLVGCAALACVQLRGAWPAYVEWQLWLDGRGVPGSLRTLDVAVVLLGAAWAGARLVAGRGEAARALGLRGSVREGAAFGLLAALPMLLHGFVGRDGVAFGPAALRAVVAMPLAMEALFRGLLVFVPVAIGLRSFWPTAIAAGLLFGSLHVLWQWPLDAAQLPAFAIAAFEGIWLAWIGRCFAWNLWPSIVLQAAMNAAWVVFGIGDQAEGTPAAHVAHGATILLGTVLALRRRRTLTDR
jgi:hypothetical protein